MKIYFKYLDIPMESVSEPFVEPMENELCFLARNMRTGQVKIVEVSNILGKTTYIDESQFKRIHIL